jgi:hypothetical protein
MCFGISALDDDVAFGIVRQRTQAAAQTGQTDRRQARGSSSAKSAECGIDLGKRQRRRIERRHGMRFVGSWRRLNGWLIFGS